MKTTKNALYGNKFVNIRENILHLGKFQIQDIISKKKTPSFVFLLDKLRANIKQISWCFSEVFPKAQGFYSMKANFFSPIIETVKNADFGAEIVGIPEFNSLKKINFPMDKIIAGGPYLPDDFLKELVKHKVGYIVVYDLEDLLRIQNEITNKNKDVSYIQKILVRFQSPKYTGRQGIALNKQNLLNLKEIVDNSPNILMKGILSHMGTRMKTLENFQKNIAFIIKTVNDLKQIARISTEIIDMGGGFPNADTLKKNQLLSILEQLKKELIIGNCAHCQIFYEPGRFLVGDIGFCLTKVYKYDEATATAFLEIGNNMIPKFMKSALRFYNASRIYEKPNKPIDFMGIIPSDQDILIKNYNFTRNIAADDIIVIANVGAYALTWSTRFPYILPSILFIDGNDIEIFHDNAVQSDFSIH
ncbi:Diaminopimelate decarboxylase [Candidatus Lokiarchaeum ossiferum]|uniref:Diaminopimelate decarboxylase n=1 Tax=Candidatus Lokiarchaeum ossiferum TaxID=2951803 RepID=A0ABY6HSH1_9ARCH|nr:Diaminopimelate decarboxylase [Candidatus Lokiarchaeum sp. B-35]